MRKEGSDTYPALTETISEAETRELAKNSECGKDGQLFRILIVNQNRIVTQL